MAPLLFGIRVVVFHGRGVHAPHGALIVAAVWLGVCCHAPPPWVAVLVAGAQYFACWSEYGMYVIDYEQHMHQWMGHGWFWIIVNFVFKIWCLIGKHIQGIIPPPLKSGVLDWVLFLVLTRRVSYPRQAAKIQGQFECGYNCICNDNSSRNVRWK